MLNFVTKATLLSLLAGCNNQSSNTPAPCETDQTAQTGVFDMTTLEVLGDCGAMGSLHVTIDNGIVLLDEGVGCNMIDTSWADNTCTTESAFDCDDGTWAMYLEWSVTTDSIDENKLTGTLLADMSKWNGIYTCYSEYKFDAVRIGDIAVEEYQTKLIRLRVLLPPSPPLKE
tara:strand:+ start:475 stop:990 length:516 start_codon:yes stop_codon:yes gene_type:complete